jgi:hypothetical protein
VARLSSAKAATAVRIRSRPQIKSYRLGRIFYFAETVLSALALCPSLSLFVLKNKRAAAMYEVMVLGCTSPLPFSSQKISLYVAIRQNMHFTCLLGGIDATAKKEIDARR